MPELQEDTRLKFRYNCTLHSFKVDCWGMMKTSALKRRPSTTFSTEVFYWSTSTTDIFNWSTSTRISFFLLVTVDHPDVFNWSTSTRLSFCTGRRRQTRRRPFGLMFSSRLRLVTNRQTHKNLTQ